ncbi:MAG TPA: protease pro-enzyme activation domain-containing protein [Terriglobales bacterium]|nr:protease pro-enzyme activation domain-containing protein [Terriglobales bacterium]
MKQRDLLPLLAVLLVLLEPSARMNAETPPARLVSETIDETRLVTLDGNVHPLAQARYDRGVVPDALPARRILLLLNRPAAREEALEQFLRDVHRRGSTIYHRWITPEQFGRQFGPADEDIETAVRWLEAKGFSVGRISKSKQFIEFSGGAGQLRDAFHSEIHEYQVKGERHYANASEISHRQHWR